VGLGGETLTTQKAVGAHLAHANQTTLHNNALVCAECHTGVSHNDVKQVAWSTFATAGGTMTPAWNTTTQTCASTYCHSPGDARYGGSIRTPVWNAGASQAACGTCQPRPRC
jgi:predicted CxxxxCH...CXXCH cytochrome family protein